MRVAHIITRLIVGGAQENTVFTVRGLTRMGYEVDLLSGPDRGPEGDLRDFAECPPVIWVPSLTRNLHPVKDIQALCQLTRLLRRGRYDLVHTHSSKAGILGRIAARLAGVPHVVHTVHGLAFDPYQPFWRNALYGLLERGCGRLTSRFITVSDRMTRQAVEQGMGPDGRFETIYSGMDLAEYTRPFDPREVRRRHGIAENAFVAGTVARLFPFKGHDLLLQAARALAGERPDIVFLLIGDGPLKGELAAQIERDGLSSNFVFAGLVAPRQVPELLSAVDLVVHLSLREGLARSLPQGMLLGKPVVTFDIGGAAEAVEDGRTGFVLPPGGLDSVVEKIRLLHDNRPLAQQMGRLGRERALERFDVETMVRRIDALYRNLTEKKPAP